MVALCVFIVEFIEHACIQTEKPDKNQAFQTNSTHLIKITLSVENQNSNPRRYNFGKCWWGKPGQFRSAKGTGGM